MKLFAKFSPYCARPISVKRYSESNRNKKNVILDNFEFLLRAGAPRNFKAYLFCPFIQKQQHAKLFKNNDDKK